MRRTLALAIAGALLIAGTPAHAAGSEVVAGSPAPAGGTDHRVTASTETPALFDDEAGGDADADDPAIWVHPSDRARSLVVGTAKNGGLRVYDLAGREIQSIPAGEGGRFNNVDITGRNLVVVTDRGRDRLRFYRIDPGTLRLTDVTVADAPLLFSADEAEVELQATGYGLATYGSLAAVSRRHTTRLGFFEIIDRGREVTYTRRETLDLPRTFTRKDGSSWTPCADPGEDPQVEGMVIDPKAGVLYAAQEDVGLWRIDLRTKKKHIVEYVAEFGAPYDGDCTLTGPGEGGRIHADVEGATIYQDYLLVSSQGDSRFFVYDRRTNKPVTTFAVTDGSRTDGVQHSDGAAATPTPLPGYPEGLLVLHDGENKPDEGRPSTNFKYVDWRQLHLC
ncbi:phytase [Couchioplanes azureus]|uniref:phytase n=1 Tax=Couchioplanes caeruleus TaxID=56438 RepID=UPI0016714C55|nr:phytase [Couchioplanes caeruleus]GGQ71865.1 hydrolase [Couchioplanes caeruleus subsp. azureus]